MASSGLNSPLQEKKHELLELVNEAFRTIGLTDFDLASIHLRVSKRGGICPPGQTAFWEAIEHADGSVTYGWVCRKS